MAKIYKDGKYYESSGGKLTEVPPARPPGQQTYQRPNTDYSVTNPNYTAQQSGQSMAHLYDPNYGAGMTSTNAGVQSVPTTQKATQGYDYLTNPGYGAGIKSTSPGVTTNPVTGSGNTSIPTNPYGNTQPGHNPNPTGYEHLYDPTYGAGTTSTNAGVVTNPVTNTGTATGSTTNKTEEYPPDWQAVIDLLGSMGQTAQGTQEDYNPSTAPSEINQALQDKVLQGLNRPYGYTDAEKALMLENAMNDFNATADQDVRQLENLSEAYGWNSGAGEMGGQGKSSFEDYYGKRAQAERGLMGDLSEQYIAQYNQDEQNAIANASAVSDMINNHDRGAFADYLSLMDFTLKEDAQSFDQLMQSAGYYSDEEQRMIMNQMGYDQMGIDSYFRTKELEASNALDYLSILENTLGLSPADALSAASYANSSEAQTLQAAIESGDSSAIAGAILGALLGGGLSGDTTTGTPVDTGDGFDFGDFNFGGFDVGDFFKNAGIDYGNPLSWAPGVLAMLGKMGGVNTDAGATFRYNGKEYTVGANGAPQLKNSSPAPAPPPDNPYDNPDYVPESTEAPEDVPTQGPPTIPGPIKMMGDMIAAYGMYRITKDTLNSRKWIVGAEMDRLSAGEAPYAVWTALKNNNVTQAIQFAAPLTNLEKLMTYASIKEGALRDPSKEGEEYFSAIDLDDGERSMMKSKGYLGLWDYASSDTINEVINSFPTDESPQEEWITFMRNGWINGYWQYDKKTGNLDVNSPFVPPLTDEEYREYMAGWVTGGYITQEQYDAEMAYVERYKSTNDAKKW